MEDRSDQALHVLLQFFRVHEADDPYAIRMVPQEYIMPTVGGESPTARFDWSREVLAELDAVRVPGRDPAVVQHMGGRLSRFLQHAGWAQHEEAILQAIAAKRRVVISIRSSASEIYALPWELLTLKTGRFLCELDGLLLRYEWPQDQGSYGRRPSRQQTPRPEGGRILFAWAGAVPVTAHRQALTAACNAVGPPFSPETDEVAQASLRSIVGRLREAQEEGPPISVLHLLCHGCGIGSTFGLSLNGEKGMVLVNAIQLREQLEPFSSMVRLVVLSACDSGDIGALGNQLGSIAQNLHRCGFAAVIASRFPLSFEGSHVLTSSLYGELLSRPASLETAFIEARKRLAEKEGGLPQEQCQLDWASVQLYARQEDGDDTRPIIIRPYRGLLPFQREHQRFFFGRAQEIRQIVEALRALTASQQPRLVLITGASGIGKSSLVFAGVVPALQETDRALGILSMRPGSDLAGTLRAVLAARPQGKRALLVIDSLEEIFTQTEAPAECSAFMKEIWECATARDSGLSVLITLRADFIGRCDELAVNDSGLGLAQATSQRTHWVSIAQLGKEELRAAIVEPARSVGLELEPHLVERLLEEAVVQPGALPLLQDTLDALWRSRSGSVLTKAAYDQGEGLTGELERRADKVINQLAKAEPADLGIAHRLLVSLVAVGESSALDRSEPALLAELRQTNAPAHAAGFERVLRELVAVRLLVQGEGADPSSRIELAHRELIREWPMLRGWLDEDRSGLRVQQRVRKDAADWVGQNRADGKLYRADNLAEIQAWRASWADRLREIEQEFLAASDARRARRQRYRIYSAVVAAATLVVLAVLALSVREQRMRVRQQERLSRSMQLVAKSVEPAQSPDRALLLAVEARRFWDSPYARSSLLWALQRGGRRPLRWLHGASQEIKRLAFASEGGTLRAIDRQGGVHHWDLASGMPVATPAGQPVAPARHAQPRQLSVAADGSILAMILERAEAPPTARFELRVGRAGGELLAAPRADLAVPPMRMQWSPDGRQLATVSAGEDVLLWDIQSGVSQRLRPQRAATPEQPAQIYQLAWSADGELLAGAAGGTIQVWTASSWLPLTELKTAPQDGIEALSFGGRSERRILAASQRSGALSLWAQEQGGFTPLPLAADAQAGQITLMCFSPDGARLAAATDKNTLLIFDLVELRLAETMPALHSSRLTALAFSRDGRTLASADGKGAVVVWDLAAQHPQLVSEGEPREQIKKLVISRTQNRIAWNTPEEPDRVRVRWVGAARGEEQQLPVHPQLTHFNLSADGQYVVTASARDGLVRLWDLSRWTRTDEFRLELPAEASQESRIEAQLTQDGLLLGTRFGSTIRFRDLARRQLLPPFSGRFEFLWDLTADGRLAVLDEPGGGLLLWDVRTGRPRGPAFAIDARHRPHAAGFSPDGSRLVEVDQAAAFRLIDVETRQPLSPFLGGEDLLEEVQLSPDGHLVAAARRRKGSDGARFLQLWDATTGYQIGPDLPGHLASVISQRFDPQEGSLSSADQWGAVLRWEVDPERWTERACRTANRNLTQDEWSGFVGDTTAYRCSCPGLPPPPTLAHCPEEEK